MKIVLEGLECRDFNRGKSEISFYILGKSKKLLVYGLKEDIMEIVLFYLILHNFF